MSGAERKEKKIRPGSGAHTPNPGTTRPAAKPVLTEFRAGADDAAAAPDCRVPHPLANPPDRQAGGVGPGVGSANPGRQAGGVGRGVWGRGCEPTPGLTAGVRQWVVHPTSRAGWVVVKNVTCSRVGFARSAR